MGKCNTHGSVADSTKEAPSFTITNFVLTGDTTGALTKTHGQSADFDVGERVVCVVTINAGGGNRQLQSNNFPLVHPEFGSPGAGMIGGFDGDSPAAAPFNAYLIPLGSKAVGEDNEVLLDIIMADTGNLRIDANSITLTDLNSGLSVTGPSSIFNVQIVASA
jgi:hypothetical protein